jgi:TRAP-type mannitol/chloroaromatic compound transport system permease small subunit
VLQSLILSIDRFSNLIGKTFAWSIVVLTAAISYEVFARYVFRAPTTWAFDASYILYGVLFMMAGGYAMARNGHVRGDFLYRNFPPRRQAALDLALWILFFYPAMIAMAWMGWKFFHQSFAQNERSAFSPFGPIIWPFKFLIPLVGCLMSLQGLAEVARCLLCLRDGDWPPRLHDVEEMEKLILERAEAERLASERNAG